MDREKARQIIATAVDWEYTNAPTDTPTNTPTNDCISRQQAIEAIEGVDWYHVNSKGELVSGSTSDEESWYKAEDIYKAIESLPPFTPTVSEDCISREWLKERIEEILYENETEFGAFVSWENIKNAPSVIPTKKMGKWIEDEYHRSVCNNCGHIKDAFAPDNYCPKCGTKMR